MRRGVSVLEEVDRDSESGEAERRGVAQPGSAFVWGTKGRWFKSSRPDQKQGR